MIIVAITMTPPNVALLAEGVDRNMFSTSLEAVCFTSPSSRRAWIEIHHTRPPVWSVRVALLAEGVDRNTPGKIKAGEGMESPSSRRAWIEIQWPGRYTAPKGVALLAEGVDRNVCLVGGLRIFHVALLAEGVDRNRLHHPRFSKVSGRPPRGGRG